MFCIVLLRHYGLPVVLIFTLTKDTYLDLNDLYIIAFLSKQWSICFQSSSFCLTWLRGNAWSSHLKEDMDNQLLCSNHFIRRFFFFFWISFLIVPLKHNTMHTISFFPEKKLWRNKRKMSNTNMLLNWYSL